MLAYYPPGEDPKSFKMTPEQIAEQKRKFDLYDKYGIPCGIFDDIPEYTMHDLQVELDRETSLLIMQHKEIPKT